MLIGSNENVAFSNCCIRYVEHQRRAKRLQNKMCIGLNAVHGPRVLQDVSWEILRVHDR